jgi:hypothetical protein
MRNKAHYQQLVGQLETIQQSFIQFIKNSNLTDGERQFLDRQVEMSRQTFEQMRTFLNQEEEVYTTPSMPKPPTNQYGIQSGRF